MLAFRLSRSKRRAHAAADCPGERHPSHLRLRVAVKVGRRGTAAMENGRRRGGLSDPEDLGIGTGNEPPQRPDMMAEAFVKGAVFTAQNFTEDRPWQGQRGDGEPQRRTREAATVQSWD